MRRWLLTLVGMLALGATLAAANAFEQITVTNAAIGFTSTVITPTTGSAMIFAACRAETAEMRYRYDGTDPTTTVGTLLEPGDVLYLNGHDNLRLFRAIRTGSTSGVLSCNYYSGQNP